MKRVAIVSLLLLALGACAGDEEVRKDEKVTPRPTEVKGAIAGRVVDPYDRPIAGAVVKVDMGKSVRTIPVGENGYFHAKDVPAGGTVAVRVEAEGHSGAEFWVDMYAEAGDYPQKDIVHDVGHILLLPLSDVLEIHVVDVWAQPVRVQGALCRVWPAWVWGENQRGNLVVPAEAEEGKLRCPGIPPAVLLAAMDGSIEVSFPAQDVNGDGWPDLEGVLWGMSAWDLIKDPSPTILLDQLGENLEVVATNAPALVWEFPLPGIGTNAPVEIYFNNPPVVLDLEVNKFDETGSLGEVVEAKAEVDGARVRIFPGASWEAGQAYRFVLEVHPVGHPRLEERFWTYFFVASSGEVKVDATFTGPPDAAEVVAGDTVWLRFSEWLYCADAPCAVGVQFERDLDGSGEVGDAPWELGNDTAIMAIVGEGDSFGMMAVFDAPVDIPVGTKVHVFMDRDPLFDTSGTLLHGSITATLEVEVE